MFTILQSILLLICANIADCCTQLTNNELIIVSKVNETIYLNIRNLFINEDISQLILNQNGSDLLLQNYMFSHSTVNNSFQQIINTKVLRSNHDFQSLNQYVLLNNENNKLELHYSDKQFFGSKARLPNFTQKILLDQYICHDLDFISQGTIVLDCYEENNNIFLIYSVENGLEIFQDEGEYIKPDIKRSINHLRNNLMIRVVFYDDENQKSVIQIYQFEINEQERKFVLAITIDDEYLQALFDDPNIELKIQQIDVIGTSFSILNQNQWFAQFNLSAFPKLKTQLFLRLKFDEDIVSFGYHNEQQIVTFQSQYHLFTVYNKTEINRTIDNFYKNNKIYYSKNFFILQQPTKITIYSLQLKYVESINIEDSILILDQNEDEIIAVNKYFSERIILSNNKYLILKSREIIQDFKNAVLQQQLSFIQYCTLSIKFKTVPLNSTKIIPIRMNQLDQVLNNQIESFSVPTFIAGPNITFKDIIQQKQNSVIFSINFEQLITKNIGILQEGTPVYSRAFQMNQLLLYLVQLSNRDLYFYYCSLQLSCNMMNITKFDFDLSQVEHQAFAMNIFYGYVVVKNNEQLDVWFLLYSSQIEYQCTIYPDQDEKITHFVYINQKIAVLQSNDQLIFYSIECFKQQKITQEFFKQDQIEWHPTYIYSNQNQKLLLIKSTDQIIVLKVNDQDSAFIDVIPLSFDSQIEIFSSPKIFWIYYLNTTIIDAYNWESIINIYFKTKISLYGFYPNKFITHPQSQYVYFYKDSDIVRTVYAYDMYANSHNVLITTFNIEAHVFCSYLNYFIIGDKNTYYQMPDQIKLTAIYKDIFNSSYLIRVNTSITIEGTDTSEQIQYSVYSGLVNPYTTILVDTEQLNLTGLVNQKKPLGSCQEKYSWYSGQVTDIGIKSQQLQLIKSIHLYNTNVSLAGLDIKHYYNDSFLILNKNSLSKLNLATKTQQVQELNLNYTYPQILLIQNEFIFVNCYKNDSYTINVINCTFNFNCSQLGDVVTPYVVKSIKNLNNFYFFIGQSIINVYILQQNNFKLLGKILANNQGGFYDILFLKDNYYQIYLIKDNVLNIHLYEIHQIKIQQISIKGVGIFETLKSQGIYVNPSTRITKVLIKQMFSQQEVYSTELFLQSYQHSHYILCLVQICRMTESFTCIINKIKVLQFFQAYGGWNSDKVEIYNQQYLFMTYQQGQTYLDVIYRIEPEYVRTNLQSTLFIGAIQHNFVTNHQIAFFTQNQQVFLLSNVNEWTVYSLYQINNNTKFCITNNMLHETVKIALKNNFDQVESIIEITTSDDDGNKQLSMGWLIFWIIMGFTMLFGVGALLHCCWKYGKKQEQLLA